MAAILGVLLFGGLPIAFVLGVTGLVAVFVFASGGVGVSIAGVQAWAVPNNFVLTAIPLFLLMGTLLTVSGSSEELFDFTTRWLGWLPGGLLVASIGACTVFAALSGTTTATIAAVGSVAYRQLHARGYDPSFYSGALAAGGVLAILIPPSITMIIYGMLTQQSVGQLFLGGVIPGILMSVAFMAYIVVYSLARPEKAPYQAQSSWQERFRALSRIGPPLAIILLVLGSIYGGLATPTEAAAVGAVGSLFLALLRRQLPLKQLQAALQESAHVTAMLLLLIVGGSILGWVVSSLRIPQHLLNSLAASQLSPVGILVSLYLVYLILGMFIDPLSMMILTVPTVAPIVEAAGFDLIWFGVILVVLVEMAMLTPPVGMNLFVVQGITGRKSFGEVVRGAFPFSLIIFLVMLPLLTVFPDIVLWLPHTAQ